MMILEVHQEYHQLIEDKVNQEEDKVWFDKLDENMCIFKAQAAQLVETRGRFTWKRVQAIFMVFQGLWDDGSAANKIRS